MRVLNLTAFLQLPEGTIYCKGVRWAFDALSVKGETLGRDWVCLPLDSIEAHDSGELFHRLDEMIEAGTSYPLNESAGRDGCFDDDAVFLVFEEADLRALRRMVDDALVLAGGNNSPGA